MILDVKMPVLDGISAAERISADRIAPVVILTAFSQRELVQRATDAGAMAYLVKPFTKTDLAPAIEMAVSRYTELRALEAEVAGLQERLETRKVVDRAKGCCSRRTAGPSPRRSAGSRRPRWTAYHDAGRGGGRRGLRRPADGTSPPRAEARFRCVVKVQPVVLAWANVITLRNCPRQCPVSDGHGE